MADYHRKDEMQSFIDLDKTSVLQETKIFNESPVCVKKCCAILAKAIERLSISKFINFPPVTKI